MAEPPWVVCPRNPLTPKRQVGAVCLGPQDEPVNQDRDSSLGMLIASGMFNQLVPGSPAAAYLGVSETALKLARTIFYSVGQFLQLVGDMVRRIIRAARAALGLVQLIGEE